MVPEVRFVNKDREFAVDVDLGFKYKYKRIVIAVSNKFSTPVDYDVNNSVYDHLLDNRRIIDQRLLSYNNVIKLDGVQNCIIKSGVSKTKYNEVFVLDTNYNIEHHIILQDSITIPKDPNSKSACKVDLLGVSSNILITVPQKYGMNNHIYAKLWEFFGHDSLIYIDGKGMNISVQIASNDTWDTFELVEDPILDYKSYLWCNNYPVPQKWLDLYEDKVGGNPNLEGPNIFILPGEYKLTSETSNIVHNSNIINKNRNQRRGGKSGRKSYEVPKQPKIFQ